MIGNILCNLNDYNNKGSKIAFKSHGDGEAHGSESRATFARTATSFTKTYGTNTRGLTIDFESQDDGKAHGNETSTTFPSPAVKDYCFDLAQNDNPTSSKQMNNRSKCAKATENSNGIDNDVRYSTSVNIKNDEECNDDSSNDSKNYKNNQRIGGCAKDDNENNVNIHYVSKFVRLDKNEKNEKFKSIVTSW